MRAVIVEDNLLSLNAFKKMIVDFPFLELIGEAYDGPEALNLINEKKPDLIFLDIELPEMNGFEVLKSVSHMPLVIFISAYDQYALKAFEANGIDYILKPVSKERLGSSLDKALSRKPHTEQVLLKLIREVLAEQKKHEHKRFAVKHQEQILLIPLEEICYFKAEDKYVFLHTNDKQYFYNATLRELEKVLDPEKFCRVNKSFIIAFVKIEKIKKTLDHGYKIIMNDSQRTAVKVSKNYIEHLKGQLNIR
jgi:DNA-binding LytR/AlgR family response regulator